MPNQTDEIKRLDRLARKNFTYVKDPDGRDEWTSHAEDVLAGRPWKGDCDDLASTVMDLIYQAKVALPHAMRRLMVSTTGGDIVDHMVGMIQDRDGKTWIIGDTFGPCYRWHECKHKVLGVAPGDSTQWFKPK